MERQRAFNIIRGTVVGSYLDNATKKELLAFLDTLEPPCERCGGPMQPETMACPECGPTP